MLPFELRLRRWSSKPGGGRGVGGKEAQARQGKTCRGRKELTGKDWKEVGLV